MTLALVKKALRAESAAVTDLIQVCKTELVRAHRAGDQPRMRELSQVREWLKGRRRLRCACGEVKSADAGQCRMCRFRARYYPDRLRPGREGLTATGKRP